MKRFLLIAIYTFIVFFFLAIASIYSGWYLKVIGDRYERQYNEERVKMNQPIIESYFVKEPNKNKQLMVWTDTTKEHVHTDKSYYLNELGKLQYEIDSYKPPIDTIWLKKQLGINKMDTLDLWTFERSFYLDKKSVEFYQILYRLKGDSYRTLTLNKETGDSLYQTFR